MEPKSFKVPAWIGGLVSLTVLSCGGVAWAYGTFVTIRERDFVKSLFDVRLENIDKRLDVLDKKIDRLLDRHRISESE